MAKGQGSLGIKFSSRQHAWMSVQGLPNGVLCPPSHAKSRLLSNQGSCDCGSAVVWQINLLLDGDKDVKCTVRIESDIEMKK